MIYRPLGSSGIDASVIGLGAWAMGGWQWGGTDEQQSINAIHAAIDEGINLIDTAPVYAFGYSEEIVGKAIKDRRDKGVLATKCGLVWDKKKGKHHFNSDKNEIREDATEIAVYKYNGAQSIRQEIEKSLKRLHVDYIDLYQTHWQEPTTPIAETMGELLKLKEEGKIRAIGVSNATAGDMEEYLQYGIIDTDQECYSMIESNAEKENLPFCGKHTISFLAYSPLAKGILSGKVGRDYTFKKGDLRNTHPLYTPTNRELVLKMIEQLQPIADDMNITMAQLCIAWTINRHSFTHALVGIRSPKQAVESAFVGEIIINDTDLDIMARAIKQYEN